MLLYVYILFADIIVVKRSNYHYLIIITSVLLS